MNDDGSLWQWQLLPETDDPDTGDVATSLPCPAWCSLPEGHGFEARPGGLLRVHRQRMGERPTHVALETYERAATAAGPTDLGADASATLVRVQFPHASGYLSPRGARALAAMLTAAVDIAEG